MREFAIRPDRELGQNFLVDSNILDVIGGLAELAPADVVLEIGGGLGVLSEYLGERVAHVHVVEFDERLRAALQDAVGTRANVTLHWGDATERSTSRACARTRARSSRICPTASPPARCCARSRSWQGRSLGRDGAARGRRAARGVPRRARLRRAVGARAARLRGPRRARRRAHRLPPGAERGLGARAVDPPRVAARRASPSCGRSWATPSPTGARRSCARLRWRRRSRGRRAGGDGYDGEAVRAALVELGHPPDARAERLSPQDSRRETLQIDPP